MTTTATEPDLTQGYPRNPDPGTWTVKVLTAPEIVCPPWCTVSVDEHRAELWESDGFCIHHGAAVADDMNLVSVTVPDGRAAPGERVGIQYQGMVVDPDEIEARALAELELVKAARA